MTDTKSAKIVGFTLALLIFIGIVLYASSVFLLAFASILLAIFLNAVGRGAKRVFRLPYPLALTLAIFIILGIFFLTFWLYSPLIAEQFQLLIKQLPQATEDVSSTLKPYLGPDFLTQSKLQEEFSLTNQKIIAQLLSVFSTTLGSVAGFVIFLIVGLYLAFDPARYVNWFLLLIPKRKQKRVESVIEKIGQSLRWWVVGKFLSMIVVGLTTLIGLSLFHVSLAFILAFLAALLTFIPYVGAIIAAIPAILIAFAQSPLTAVYVTILYVGIHVLDGYFITPAIEQRTVAIPPALTIMGQVLMVVLIGGVGLALATPLIVVGVALIHHSLSSASPLKMTKQSQHADND